MLRLAIPQSPCPRVLLLAFHHVEESVQSSPHRHIGHNRPYCDLCAYCGE